MKAGLWMYFALFLVITLLASLIFALLKPSVPIPTKNQVLVTQTANPLPKSSPVVTATAQPKEFQFSAWIPSWGSASALSSLKNNLGSFEYSSISPVWYELKEDGSLANRYSANRNELENWLRDKQVSIIPAVACFDHEIMTKVLQDPEHFERQINELVKRVLDNNYDGIDLDYESTKLSDKDKYFEFLSELATHLQQNGKKLVVTVVAKWGEGIEYPSLIETRQVQDWARISQYADEIRIMAYDYTYISSSLPGPIAPSGWVSDVLEYATSLVPPEKIVLGIALYSYEWSAPVTEPVFNYTPSFLENSAGSKSAAAYQYKEVLDIKKRHPDAIISEFEDESYLTYESSGKRYLLSYFTPENIKARVELAKAYGIKGVVFWRIGNEANQLELL